MSYKLHAQILVLILTIVAFSSCKKEAPEVTQAPEMPAADARQNPAVLQTPPETTDNSERKDAQPDFLAKPPIDESTAIIVPNSPTANPAAPVPTTDQTDPCLSYRDNPLFQDKHVFQYQVQLSNRVFDIEADDYDCDASGECTRDVSFDLACHVVRISQDRGYCASKLECKANPDNFQSEIPDLLEGYWFRDENGFYLLNSPDFQISGVKKENGDCTQTKYIDCKPGTLAYDFAYFSTLIPTIPTLKRGSVDETNTQEDSTRHWKVAVKDNTWCTLLTISGADDFDTQLCVNDTQGIVRFSNHFSGGSDREFTAQLHE